MRLKSGFKIAHVSLLPNANELIMGVVLGCIMAWVSMSFKSLNMFGAFEYGETILDAIYLASIVTTMLVFVIAGIANKKTVAILDRTAFRRALPCVIALSTILMPFSSVSEATGFACIFASGILSGSASALFHVQIGRTLCSISLKNVIVVAAIGVIISGILFALFCLFSPFEACVFSISMPVIAGLLMECKIKYFPLRDYDIDGIPSSDPRMSSMTETREYRRLTGKLTLCSVLVGFANEAARTLYIQMGLIDTEGTLYAVTQGIISVMACIGVAVIAYVLLNRRTEFTIRTCYHILIVMLIVAVLALPIPFIYEGFSVPVLYTINTVSYACFAMFVWVVTIALCQRYPDKQIRAFSFIRGGWAAGPLFGMILGRIVLHLTGLYLGTTFPVMLIGTVALLLTGSVVIRGSDLSKAMNIKPDKYHHRFREKCLKVVKEYSLSEREGEIMILLAKGRNLPYIQENLCLSKSTVSTHRQHIHQKLNIHTQQELIDLIEGIDG